MRDKIYKSLVIIFYLISLFILIACMQVRFDDTYYLNSNFRVLLLIIVCLLIYINGLILVKKLNYDKKILKINLIIYCLIYTFAILSLTLFDEFYGRNGIVRVNWNKNLLKQYMKYSFNIIPFKTIKLFTYGYLNKIVSFKNFSANIIGNLCAFMPYGIFLPMIFKKINKYYKFLISMIIIILVIELMQFLTLSGSCDIDDLILNVIGASIIYSIARIKCIMKFLNKTFLFK